MHIPAMEWRAAFGGFAPGFTYLTPTGDWWDVPRHSQPRPSIPAGSVGLAGEFSGGVSPGVAGWMAAAGHYDNPDVGSDAGISGAHSAWGYRAIRGG